MKSIDKYFDLIFLIALTITGCIYSNSLTDGITSSKSLWVIFISAILLSYLGINYLYKKYFYINALDTCVISFFSYIIINAVFHGLAFFSPSVVEDIGLIIAYISAKKIFANPNFLIIQYLYLVFLIVSIQVIVAALQWFQFMPSYNSNYKFSGFFFNPSPFVIFLSALSIYGLSSYLCSSSKLVKYCGIASFLLSIPVIVISQSRSAWIGLFVGIIFIVSFKYNLVGKYKHCFYKTFFKYVTIGLTIAAVLFASFYIYNFKKDSADGRLLIWKVSLKIIEDNSLTGIGKNNFPVTYLNYQAKYFEQHSNRINDEGRLADPVFYSFNDFLQILVEQGILGFSLIVTSLLLCARYFKYVVKQKQYENSFNIIFLGSASSLIIIITSGLFSYPLVILPLEVIFCTSIALISIAYDRTDKRQTKQMVFQKSAHVPVILVCATIAIGLIYYSFCMYNAFSMDWQGGDISNIDYKTKAKKNRYRFIISDQDWYLMDQCDYFLKNGNTNQAIIQFEQTKKSIPSKYIYYTLGYLYEKQNKYFLAEKQYQFLTYALPGLLAPKYLLTKLYYKTGQMKKWQEEANQVLEFKPKVSSDQVNIMIEDVKSEYKLIHKN